MCYTCFIYNKLFFFSVEPVVKHRQCIASLWGIIGLQILHLLEPQSKILAFPQNTGTILNIVEIGIRFFYPIVKKEKLKSMPTSSGVKFSALVHWRDGILSRNLQTTPKQVTDKCLLMDFVSMHLCTFYC